MEMNTDGAVLSIRDNFLVETKTPRLLEKCPMG